MEKMMLRARLHPLPCRRDAWRGELVRCHSLLCPVGGLSRAIHSTTTHRSPMFSTARCLLPPRTLSTIPSRRTPALTVVSAKPRRGAPRRDHRSWGGGSDDDDGADVDRIDDRFFGDARDDEPEPELEEEAPASAAPEPAGRLRGSDVLRALQRAAAAKEARKKSKKRTPAPAARRLDTGEKGGDERVAAAARPIEIRPEWATRIRELELRVQQLVDKYPQ